MSVFLSLIRDCHIYRIRHKKQGPSQKRIYKPHCSFQENINEMNITAATDDGGGIGAPTLKYFSIMQVSIHRPISITFNRNN